VNRIVSSEKDLDLWDHYVTVSGSASCYHLSRWKDVIEESFGHKTFYLISTDQDGNINGILPLVMMRSFLFGNFMVSLPYFNYGGVCADTPEIALGLIGEAAALARREGSSHIELRHTCRLNGLPEKTGKVSMRLELCGNPDELWDRFSSKLRSQIRRPQKEGMVARFGRENELLAFYRVFSTNMRDLGTPVYGISFFRNILKTFPDSSWICTIYNKDGRPVASGFLIGFKKTLEILWASSLRDFNHLSPNMLLYWNILSFACKRNFGVFDFGRSTPGEGTYRFKEQWGAKPVQLYWHYWTRDAGPLPELNPKNPKYSIAIQIWKRLPVALTKIIGPAIVKNLP